MGANPWKVGHDVLPKVGGGGGGVVRNHHDFWRQLRWTSPLAPSHTAQLPHVQVINGLRGTLALNAAAVQYPIGLEDDHCGVVDLVRPHFHSCRRRRAPLRACSGACT